MALQVTRDQFRLPHKVEAYQWDELEKVPFIRGTGAGWGYIGKKGDGDNHTIAISRAVGNLYSWLEGQPSWKYTPNLAWTRT